MALALEDLDADFGEVAALVVPDPPPPQDEGRPKPRWEQRSAALLAFARERRGRQLAEERLAACRNQLATLRDRLCPGPPCNSQKETVDEKLEHHALNHGHNS